jgi:hypothetical protein
MTTHLLQSAKFKTRAILNMGGDGEEWEMSLIAGEAAERHSYFGRQFTTFYKVKHSLTM